MAGVGADVFHGNCGEAEVLHTPLDMIGFCVKICDGVEDDY